MSFYDNLATGRVAEGYISQWLMSRGAAVMPAYEIEISQGKGPQLFMAEGEFVLPDMLVFTPKRMLWAEAKHKSVFTWHRQTRQWMTGIDLHHYTQYLHVAKQTRLPVWLFFFHANDDPADQDKKHGCPDQCPAGLFGEELFTLVAKEDHRCGPKDTERSGHIGHGRSGMVYWAESDLRMFASCDDVYSIALPDGRAKPIHAQAPVRCKATPPEPRAPRPSQWPQQRLPL